MNVRRFRLVVHLENLYFLCAAANEAANAKMRGIFWDASRFGGVGEVLALSESLGCWAHSSHTRSPLVIGPFEISALRHIVLNA